MVLFSSCFGDYQNGRKSGSDFLLPCFAFVALALDAFARIAASRLRTVFFPLRPVPLDPLAIDRLPKFRPTHLAPYRGIYAEDLVGVGVVEIVEV